MPQEGQLKAFDKNYFYIISLPDLLADLALILFSFFISEQLFASDGLFLHVRPWQNVAMYCVVTLTVPWYLGFLYVQNAAYYTKPAMRIFLWVFILMTLMILIHLMRLVFLQDIEHSELNGINGFTAIFALFLLILGPMMCMGGAMQARREFSEGATGDGRFDPYKLSEGSGAFIILILGIACMIFFIGLLPKDAGFLLFTLAFIGGPFGAVLVFALFVLILQGLDKIGVYKYLRVFAVNTFPFFIISVLVFWSGVALHFMQSDFGNAAGKISKGAMIITVCISGLVPFRLVMLFNAPVRLSNLALGFVSLSYFFYQMMQIVG